MRKPFGVLGELFCSRSGRGDEASVDNPPWNSNKLVCAGAQT
jgi:hypothetical protein